MTHIDEFEEPTYVEPYKYDDTYPRSGTWERLERKPVHESDITDSGIIAAVRRAYRDTQPNKDVTADGSRRLSFVSSWQNPHDMETLWAIGFVGQYNWFEPEKAQWLASSLDETKTKVAIGREGSPVLYFWTLEPRRALDLLTHNHFCVPDELSIYSGNAVYPTSGQFKLPDHLEFDRYWIDRRTGKSEDDADINISERSGPVLIRAWWD